jgi:hypothetical protein
MATMDPEIWLEMTVQPYPSGSASVYRFSTKPIAAANSFIEGRVLARGWGTLERALSDWRGNIEASAFSVQLEDSDGLIRGLIESFGVTAFPNPETAVKLLSEAGRAAGLTPRVIHRGYLGKSPQPLPNRKAQLESVDVLGSRFYHFAPEAPLQKVFITREHLEAAGLYGTPADVLGKPYNIIIGEHSDAGTLDINGNDAAKGMIPPDLLGTEHEATQIVQIPPPVLSASVVGTPGGDTGHYQVTMLTANGETVGSNIVTVSNVPEPRDASNYVELTWTAPSGWEAIYASMAVAFRVCGRTHNPPATYLDMMNNGGTFTSPEYEYHDDHDQDIEKLPAAPAVGTATVVLTNPNDPSTLVTGDIWTTFAVGLGHILGVEVYGSDLVAGGEPSRTLLNTSSDPDLQPPEVIEIGTGADQIRVTVFYAKGVRVQQHLDGIVKFAVNCCGVEEVGDGTGDPITEAGPGLQWLLNEIALKDEGTGYRTGNYGPLEMFTDGTTPILKPTTFSAFQALTAVWIGGRGYQMHLALTETVTLSQVLQWACLTFHIHVGTTQHGQVGIWALDPSVDTSTAPHYRVFDVHGPLPAPEIAEEEVENRLRFRYGYDPDLREYPGDMETIEHLGSQDLYGLKDASGSAVDSFLELRCTRDQVTARNAMARRLYQNRIAPIYQPVPLSLRAMESDLGSVFVLTHHDGVGVNGYIDQPFFTVRHADNPNPPVPVVTPTGRDMYRMVTDLTANVMSPSATMPFVMV